MTTRQSTRATKNQYEVFVLVFDKKANYAYLAVRANYAKLLMTLAALAL